MKHRSLLPCSSSSTALFWTTLLATASLQSSPWTRLHRSGGGVMATNNFAFDNDDFSHDAFSYHDTTDTTKRIYAPQDWQKVDCTDHEHCPGWPTNLESMTDFYIPYNEETTNQCHDCSSSTGGVCHRHKQSPIDLWRNITVKRDCKDRHWMKHDPGNCKFGQMEFQVLPHVLRAYQPPSCNATPNIDYSFGFPHPWDLQYTDISVPSHHYQDGHQYAGEITLVHTYSKNTTNRYIGNVAIFLEEGTDDDHYDFMELYIRRWRVELMKIYDQCGQRRLGEADDEFADVMAEDFEDDIEEEQSHINTMRRTVRIQDDGREPMQVLNKPHFSREFHPYDWYEKTETEYYFRYRGSTLTPPCMEHVHWRVMKDPIKVSPDQLHKLERLFPLRLNPVTCKKDTVGKLRADGFKVDVNRPIQTRRNQHAHVFCECVDWKSRSEKDREWCKKPMEERGVIERTFRPTPAPVSSPNPTMV